MTIPAWSGEPGLTHIQHTQLKESRVEITEVRIKLMDLPGDRLQGFCSITLDGEFVVRDLKIIQGQKSAFVAMPSRKLTDKCIKCSMKNDLRARYCSSCGVRLPGENRASDTEGKSRLFADIAHPINSACREKIQSAVLTAFELEKQKAAQPGYICTYDEYDEDYSTSRSDSFDSSTLPPD